METAWAKNIAKNFRKCPQKVALPAFSLLFSRYVKFAKTVKKIAALTHI